MKQPETRIRISKRSQPAEIISFLEHARIACKFGSHPTHYRQMDKGDEIAAKILADCAYKVWAEAVGQCLPTCHRGIVEGKR